MENIEFLTRKNVIFTLLNSSIMLLIFVADLQFATEIFIGVLYLVVILLTLWLPNTKYTLFFALASTLLCAVGYFYSIYDISISHYFTVTNFINLNVMIATIWISAVITIYIKKLNTAIQTNETTYRSILAASIDPIIIIDDSGVITSASSAIEKTFGWSSSEICGKHFNTLLASSLRNKYDNLFKNSVDITSNSLLGDIHEIIGQHRMRRDFPCEVSINRISINDFSETFFTAIFRDISKRKLNELKMGWLSTHDELTKIYNRHYLNEQIEREWRRLLRSQAPLAIIIIDVDYFKNYNDYLGHQSGDSCLQKIATSLELAIRRSNDFVARFGGEEFVIILPETDINGAKQVAENIQSKIRSLNILHPSSTVSKKVSVSMGIASMIPSKGCSYERLFKFADQALYNAKNNGRDRYCIHEE
jgi:diguanylate cyclase (GGDEF)-like protein/PAS domain S-box-containing protein